LQVTRCKSCNWKYSATNFKINIKLNDEIVCKNICEFEDVILCVKLDSIFKESIHLSNLSCITEITQSCDVHLISTFFFLFSEFGL
jgi:hypothetical protein